ncbi:MAG TPA: M1 family aminopeptidase [Vicinamibacterales bacterium]|nr:M1 family aminopeptidase [Vicinamibacterales bacterium]
MHAIRAFSLCSLWCACVASAAHAQEPGISETLARERAGRVSNVRYELSFSIPREKTSVISGHEVVSFALADASAPLFLDFEPSPSRRLRTVTVGGDRIDATLVNGHLTLPASSLRRGDNRVAIDFDAGDAPLNRNDDFLYTILVPARAHEAFPCFDQPDLKARWTLTLDVPDGWETLANGEETSRSTSEGRTHVTFGETQPISTYLFAFAAGKFSVERGERNGRTMRMFHRETDAAKVARNRDAIFALHAAAIDWMQRYTGIPYPFGKFDFLLVPAFQFGGMEHPGAIFYNASALLLDPSATQNDMLERASVISHETAHMWFGDLVTMRWFNDVWLKEVFANFMAAKIVNPSFPTINHDLRFLLDYYPLAYDIDRTEGSNPIRQRLANLNEAGTLYGNIIYDKAPIVMRQLERLVGEDSFRDGLRDYLKRFSFLNATWPELIQLLDDRTPEDLAAWSHAWVDEDRRPSITVELKTARGHIDRLALTQRDPASGRGLLWNQQLDVVLGYADHLEHLPVHLSEASVEIDKARGRLAPLFVLPNGGGLAYGEVHLDAASRDWLAANAPSIRDPLTRGSAWLTLWDAVLDGELTPAQLVELALHALPRETDELNVEGILDQLRTAYWRFTPAATRRRLAPRVEQILRTRLASAPTQSLKGAYFAAIRSVSLTPASIEWLTSVWDQRATVRGLTLAEPDYIALAQDLAIKDGAHWRSIVTRQIDRTKDPDRKARLTFVAPSLSSDASERDRFFASLADVSNRRHEPWVLDGLRALHHPLRGDASATYVQPSLALLRDIQRTGDIFFPKRWMDATLGGYTSPDKAQTVRTFLAGLPADYPDRLRRIVLSSADLLFRSARMK